MGHRRCPLLQFLSIGDFHHRHCTFEAAGTHILVSNKRPEDSTNTDQCCSFNKRPISCPLSHTKTSTWVRVGQSKNLKSSDKQNSLSPTLDVSIHSGLFGQLGGALMAARARLHAYMFLYHNSKRTEFVADAV